MRKIFKNIIVKNFIQDENKIEDPAYLVDRKNYVSTLFVPFGKI